MQILFSRSGIDLVPQSYLPIILIPQLFFTLQMLKLHNSLCTDHKAIDSYELFQHSPNSFADGDEVDDCHCIESIVLGVRLKDP
jgi:hypothetical protein